MVQVNGAWENDGLDVVKREHATNGVYAGALLSRLLATHNMQVEISFPGFCPTYHGPRVESSWIDVIAAPTAL
eukprot:1167285-Pyramimonas_sp.AAC.1